MRTQTLDTYVKSKFKSYYDKPLRFSSLLTDSAKDERLAELSQVYYLIKGDQKKADKFMVFTREKYFVETFMLSDQKYVYQFLKQRKARNDLNNLARKKLKYLFEEENYSMYRVAKELGTNQSNLNEFYTKYKNGKLNSEKVFKVYGW